MARAPTRLSARPRRQPTTTVVSSSAPRARTDVPRPRTYLDEKNAVNSGTVGARSNAARERAAGQPPALSIFAHVSLRPTVRLKTGRVGVWSFQSATK